MASTYGSVLSAAGLEDTEDNRALVREIAAENEISLLGDFETDIEPQAPAGPPIQMPPQNMRQLQGPPQAQPPVQALGRSFQPPPTDVRNARADAVNSMPGVGPYRISAPLATRIGASAIEGVTKPILQLLGEASEPIRTHFPGGALNLELLMQSQGLIGEATMIDRIASKTTGIATFFAPIGAAGAAVRAGLGVGKAARAAGALVEPALVGMASVLDARSQTGTAGGEKFTKEDWHTFGHSAAFLGAGMVLGKALSAGVKVLSKGKAGAEIHRMVREPALGAAFGLYTAHNEKLDREEFAEEVVSSALGFYLGSYIGGAFKGASKPLTEKQGEGAIQAALKDADTGAEKFIRMSEGPVEIEGVPASAKAAEQARGYATKLQAAKNFWANSQLPVEGQRKAARPTGPDGEKVGPKTIETREPDLPSQKELQDAFGLTETDAIAVRQGRWTDAERAEAIKNRRTMAILESAAKRGNDVLQETMYKMGVMPEAERKLYSVRRSRIPPEELAVVESSVPTAEQAFTEATIPQERALVPTGMSGEPRGLLPAPGETSPTTPPLRERGPTSYPPPETPAPSIRIAQEQAAAAEGRIRKAAQAPPTKPQKVSKKATARRLTDLYLSGQPAGPPAPSRTAETIKGQRPPEPPPGTQHPPEVKVAAPPPSIEQAVSRLDAIKAELGQKGVTPERRQVLKQEQQALSGTRFPADAISTRSLKDVWVKNPEEAPRVEVVQAKQRLADPKATPSDRLAAEAVLEGDRAARAATAKIEASKPPLPPPEQGLKYMSGGLDWVRPIERWIASGKFTPPKPSEAPVLQTQAPGPRAIERTVEAIDDAFYNKAGRRAEYKRILDEWGPEITAEVRGEPGAAPRVPLGDFVPKFVLPTVDAMRQYGPSGNALADASMRTWRRTYSRLGQLKYRIDKADRGGTSHQWDAELPPASERRLNDFMDAYSNGKRGTDLPSLTNVHERMAAAAAMQEKYLRIEGVDLPPAALEAARKFGEQMRAETGSVAEDAVASGMPFKAWSKSPYYHVSMRPEVFAPTPYWEKVGTVFTDQGPMTKAAYKDAVGRANELQTNILDQMATRRPDLSRAEVEAALLAYKDAYMDPFARKMNPDGLQEAPNVLNLHRLFDIDAGNTWDPAKRWKRYFKQAYLGLEMTAEFGPGRERAESLMSAAGRDKLQMSSLADLFNTGMLQDPRAHQPSPRALSELRGAVHLLKLGKVVFKQIPQNVTIAAHTDLQSYMQAIPEAVGARVAASKWIPEPFKKKLGNELAAEYVAESGALIEFEIQQTLANMQGVLPKAARVAVEASGLARVDRFNRAHAAIGAKIYAKKVLNEYQLSGGEAKKNRADALKELYSSDPKMLQLALRGKWTPQEMRLLQSMAGEAVAYKTQFRTDAIDMPMAYSDPTFRVMYDLRGFSVRATAESMRQLNFSNPDAPIRNKAVRLRWAAGLLAAGMASWKVNRLLKMMDGKDPEEDPEWVQARDALVGIGMLPLFMDAWNMGSGRYGDPDITGPAIGLGFDATKAVAQSAKSRSNAPLGRFAIKNAPFIWQVEGIRATEWGQENIPTRKDLMDEYFPGE